MAFGFGFNKQKVLAAAEKYVQQGKLQNAIAEYEKILKNDPKDLTVTKSALRHRQHHLPKLLPLLNVVMCRHAIMQRQHLVHDRLESALPHKFQHRA